MTCVCVYIYTRVCQRIIIMIITVIVDSDEDDDECTPCTAPCRALTCEETDTTARVYFIRLLIFFYSES